MTQNVPNLICYVIGDSSDSRRAVSYTPASAMTLYHWSFVGIRHINQAVQYDSSAWDAVTEIDWEIRSATTGHKPNTTAASLLASGSFDWRYESTWKLWRPIKFTINLAEPLELSASTEYWFVLKMPNDETHAEYVLAWATTYETGASGEVDATVYSSAYTAGGSWANGTNTYNLSLEVLDDQAGKKWHVVVDGKGYMSPDNLRSYTCEQTTSSLAATRGGQSDYSQLRYPYSNLSQGDWSSGSGQLVQEDLNAFHYSLGLDTSVPNQMIIGPAVHLTGVETNYPMYDPSAVTARTLPDHEMSTTSAAASYVAQKFTAPSGGLTATKVGVRINRQPWQRLHTASVAIFSDSTGSPGSNLSGWVALYPLYKWSWNDATINVSLSSSTAYWVVVKTDQSVGALPEYRLMYDQAGSYTGGAAKYSTDSGSTWSVLTGFSLAFRINYGTAGAMNGDVAVIKYGTVNSTGTLVAGAGKKVYTWNNTSGYWEDISTGIEGAGNDTTTDDITDVIMFNDNLFVAQGYSHNVRYYNGAAWADAGYAAKYFYIAKGYLWASTAVNEVKHSNDGTTLSSAITVGENLYEITGIINYSGQLLIGKEDGIWAVDDQDLAQEYLLFREHAAPSNCVGWTVWSGMLFIPVQNTVWRWQGSQYKDVGPVNKRSGPSKSWPNKVSRMVATAPYLVAAASPAVSTGWGGLMFYNGLGWHHVAVATRPNQTVNAICVTSEIGTDQTRLWLAEGDRVTYFVYPNFTNNRYDWTSADFEITGAQYVSSWWDGGLKDALKFWNRFTAIADIASGTSIEVYCARDGEEWETANELTFIGELRPETLTNTGEYTLMFPDGMVAKSIQLVFLLKTTSSSLTPRIKAFNVESVVRQIPVYVYTFRVLLANNITCMDGTTESTRTANDMWEELKRASVRNDPIIVSFPFKSIRGMISYLNEKTMQLKPDGMSEDVWERVAVVSVVEAT